MSGILSDRPLATHHYYDRLFEIDAVKVLPGEYYVTAKDIMLTTVLGSCVSACIRDTQSGLGGMNHFLLPDGGAEGNPLSETMRYGAYAMEILINDLMKAGARRERLSAKVFGGGNVLPGMTTMNVGARNASFVLDYLKTERIPIEVQDLLDVYPRRVVFWPKTGKAMVKKLRKAADEDLVRREQDYRRRVSTTHEAGSIDLF